MKAHLLILALCIIGMTACNAPTPPPPPPPLTPSPTGGSLSENTPTVSLFASTATLSPSQSPAPSQPTVTSDPAAGTGTITGHTLFSNNAPVSGLLVKLDGQDTTTTTAEDGSYTLAGVPAGDHTVSARAPGLGSGQPSVFVRANETTVQDLVVFIFFEITPPTPDPNAAATAPAPDVSGWTGAWVLNFGSMKLSQKDSQVSGVYFDAFTNINGTIQGVISGSKVDGTWSDGNNKGPIHWLLSANGDAFTGNFNDSTTWCGARSGKPFPVGCSFAGTWTTQTEGNEKCLMKLTRTDLNVRGVYCDGSLSGVISYTGKSEETILTGGRSTKAALPIKLTLLGYNALQFQGSWDQKNSWCGWRGNQRAPSPCLR